MRKERKGGDDQLELSSFLHPSHPILACSPPLRMRAQRRSLTDPNTHSLDSLRLSSLRELQVQIKIDLPLLLDAPSGSLGGSETGHKDFIFVGYGSSSGSSEVPGFGVFEVEDEVGVRSRRGGNGQLGFERSSSDSGDGREPGRGSEDGLEGVVT